MKKRNRNVGKRVSPEKLERLRELASRSVFLTGVETTEGDDVEFELLLQECREDGWDIDLEFFEQDDCPLCFEQKRMHVYNQLTPGCEGNSGTFDVDLDYADKTLH